MSHFWGWFVAVLALGNLIGFAWLLLAMRKIPPEQRNQKTTGHKFDGIEEYNNPFLVGGWVCFF